MKASRPRSAVNAERALVMMLRSGGVVVPYVEHIDEKRDRRRAKAGATSWRQSAPNGKCSSVKVADSGSCTCRFACCPDVVKAALGNARLRQTSMQFIYHSAAHHFICKYECKGLE